MNGNKLGDISFPFFFDWKPKICDSGNVEVEFTKQIRNKNWESVAAEICYSSTSS